MRCAAALGRITPAPAYLCLMGLMLAFNASGMLAIQGLQQLQTYVPAEGFMQQAGITPPRLSATMLALNAATLGLVLVWRQRRLPPWGQFSRLLPPPQVGSGNLWQRLVQANDATANTPDVAAPCNMSWTWPANCYAATPSSRRC